MKKIHYAWIICAAGTLLIFISMGACSNAFSVYLPYIRDNFGLTNTQTSTLVTMRITVGFLCMLVIGKYYSIFTIRTGATIASGFAAVAFVLYALAHNYPTFVLAAAVSGIPYGLGSMVPVSILMSRWFDEHRALAISICSAGSGLGAIVLPPIITGLIGSFDLYTVFLIEALFTAFASLLFFLVVRNYPEEKGISKYGAENMLINEGIVEPKIVHNAGHSIEKNVLVIATIGCLLMGAQGNPGMSHIPVLFTSTGFSEIFSATLLSIVGAALIFGKVIYGEITDKVGGLKSSMLFCVFLITGNILCCMAFTGSTTLSLISAFVLGLGYSVSTVGPSIWAGGLSSEQEYSNTVRIFQITYSLGAVITASVPGMLADVYGGSYIPAYILFTVISVSGTILVLIGYLKHGTE